MPPNQLLIARSARWTRWLVIALLVGTVSLHLLTIIPGPAHIQLHRINSSPVSSVLNQAHLLFIAIALVQLILLLRHLERGELFSAGVTRRLRGFALFTMLGVMVGAIIAPVIAYMAPQCSPGEPCLHRLPLDMRGLWGVVSSLIFFLVARLLDEARRIDEDHRQII